MSAHEPAYLFNEAPVAEPVAEPSRRHGFLWCVSAAAICLVVLGASTWIGIERWTSSRADIRIEGATVLTDESTTNASLPGKVKQILVKPGDRVTRGQVVALLDDAALLAVVKQDQLALDKAQKEALATQAAILPPPIIGSLPAASPKRSAKAERGPDSKDLISPKGNGQALPAPANGARKAHAASVIRQVEEARQQANDHLKAAQADLSAATQEAQAARAPMDGLQGNLEMAKSQREKFQDLYNQGIISRQEFQNKQADVDAAQVAVDQAQKQIADADTAVKQRQSEVDSINKGVQALTAQLQASEKQFASIPVAAPPPQSVQPVAPPAPLPSGGAVPRSERVRPLGPAMGLMPVRVAFPEALHKVAQDKVAAAQAELAKAQALLKSAQIVADSDGVVSSVEIQPGQMVLAGQTVVTIAKPGSTRVEAFVVHRDALRVHKGEQCTVGVPGARSVRLPGLVDHFVTPGNEATPAKIEIKVLGPTEQLTALPEGTKLSVVIHP